MKRKLRTAEQIVKMLREADTKIGQGSTVGEVCRELGISEPTYCNWRKQYGQMKLSHVKQLKELQKENSRLKKLVAGGCSLDDSPRPRLGCYATSTPGGRFIDTNGLGNHSYRGNFSENNGIAYTCRGGHIDVTHARIGADNTRYLYNKTKKDLLEGDTKFTYSLNVDRSTYYVTLGYPDNWKDLPEAVAIVL